MIRIVTVLCLLLISVGVAAHHSAVMYDREKKVTLEGVVKKFQYTNPHSWLLVTVTDENGDVSTWGFEAEGPSTLLRAGIRIGDFAPGTEITITGNPMRDGRHAAAWINAVRKSDGKQFFPKKGFSVNR